MDVVTQKRSSKSPYNLFHSKSFPCVFSSSTYSVSSIVAKYRNFSNQTLFITFLLEAKLSIWPDILIPYQYQDCNCQSRLSRYCCVCECVNVCAHLIRAGVFFLLTAPDRVRKEGNFFNELVASLRWLTQAKKLGTFFLLAEGNLAAMSLLASSKFLKSSKKHQRRNRPNHVQEHQERLSQTGWCLPINHLFIPFDMPF